MNKKVLLAWCLVAFVFTAFGESVTSAAGPCQCVAYARCATGVKIYGDAYQWDNLAPGYGYKVVNRPYYWVAMNFEKGKYGAHPLYGHVGMVVAYQDLGTHWKVKVRHANWAVGPYFTHCGCTNVSETWFVVKKNDGQTHYIY